MALADKERYQNAINNRELPDEMLLEVLVKLPPKSVLRFKCVSKHWLSLITNPHFVNTYQDRSDTRLGGVSLVIPLFLRDCERRIWHHRFLIIDLKKPPQSRATVYDPKLPRRYSSRISNMVNGIICFYQRNNYRMMENIFLYNLTTREILSLPPSGVRGKFETMNSWTDYYLGFSAASKAYKLLRFQEIRGGYTESEVLTLGANSWREIKISLPSDSPSLGIKFCLDGVLYGITYQPFEEESSYGKLFAFDVEHETYKLINYPQSLLDQTLPPHKTPARLVHLQGQVSVVDLRELSSGDIEISVWRLISQKSNGMLDMPVWSNEEKITCSVFGGMFSRLSINQLGQINYFMQDDKSGKWQFKIFDIASGKTTLLKTNNPEGILFANSFTFEPQKVIDNITPLKHIGPV